MYICKYETLAHFNLAVAKVDRQTAKFNSSPNFPAIRYILDMTRNSFVYEPLARSDNYVQ